MSSTQGSARHKFIRDCPVRDLIRLIRGVDTQGTDWDSSYIIEYFERMYVQNIISSVEVVLMSTGQWRTRSYTTSGRINNLMVGRSSNYVGDEHFHNDRIQLQIHFVQQRGNEQNRTTAFALHIPSTSEYDLSFVIRGERQ